MCRTFESDKKVCNFDRERACENETKSQTVIVVAVIWFSLCFNCQIGKFYIHRKKVTLA